MLSTSKQKFSDLIDIVNDPNGLTTEILSSIRPNSQRLRFVLSLAATRSSDVPGVSAAGTTPETRRLTPALDAQLLVSGRQAHESVVPRSPEGVVSPVVITRACLELLACPVTIVDCGVFQQPKTQFISLGDKVADCISTGAAQDRNRVNRLFERGFSLGRQLAEACDCLILAESVPGGTTTAKAVLTLIGYKTDGLVSSSLPIPNHKLRHQLIEAGLKHLKQRRSSYKEDPLACVAAMGDPMQAVVLGAALSAGKTVPVLLAGGSQMLAVYALAKAKWKEFWQGQARPKLAVCTTKWVVNDRNADTRGLARLIEAPLASASIDFTKSRHAGMRAYEEGHVKEGCGAGAAILLVCLTGLHSESEIITAIDKAYEQMVE